MDYILIEKVRIKNFRSLKDIEVNLTPITILVGPNNAGKTTFLRALNSVLGLSKNQINQDDLFIDKKGNKTNDPIIIDIKIIPVDEKGNRLDELSNAWISKLGGADNLFDENGKDVFAFRTKYSFGIEDTPITTYQLFADWDNEKFKEGEFKSITQVRNNIKLYFIDAQRDILEDSSLRTSFFGRLVSQLDYGESLEQIKKSIEKINQEAIDKAEVLKHLAKELSKLNKTTKAEEQGVSINPFPKNIRDLHKGMKVYFQDKGSDSFSMENHGMGTRSWASIITAGAFTSWETTQIEKKIDVGVDTNLLFPLFALEEPEAHLHPNAQRTLYNQLKEFKGQKIISTHSPYIAGQAELTELRHFFKETDVTAINEIENNLSPEIYRKIKNEVIDSMGELLFANGIILFEGQTERLSLPIFAAHYFKRPVYELGIFLINVNGNNYKPFIKLAQMLKIPWFIFSDYDKTSIRKGVDNAIDELGETIDESQVIKLEMPIEKYLIQEGYQIELKNGINNCFLDGCNQETPQQQIDAGQKQINSLKDNELLNYLAKDDSKVKFPKFWASEIIKKNDNKDIPQKIKDLFIAIDKKLSIKIE